MSLLDSLRYRLGVLLRPRDHDRELGEEMEFHLDLESMQQKHRAARVDDARSTADAPFAARRRFGNVTYYHEESRRASGLGWFDVLWQDVRFALRTFRRAPTFTLVVIATLGIGIGANTAIFSVFDALLLRPLPFREPNRLMNVSLAVPARGTRPPRDEVYWSLPKFAVFRANQAAFEDATIVFSSQFTVRVDDDAVRDAGEAVDSHFLSTLGVAPALGRGFLRSDDASGATRVVLLSNGLWQRAFNADPNVAGRTMDIDGSPYTVIGVMPSTFVGVTGDVSFWFPAQSFPKVWDNTQLDPYNHSFFGIARLARGVTPERAQMLVRQLGPRIDAAYPSRAGSDDHWGAAARELDTMRIDTGVRRAMVVLFGAVGLVLLIACANVANLYLVRASSRRREIAVRLAIGASRWRIVRQLLVESVLLGLAGGAVSLVVAWLGVNLLPALAGADVLRNQNLGGIGGIGLGSIHIDRTALAFTAGLAVLTGFIFGLVPALQSTRPALTDSLKDDGAARTTRVRGISARNALIVAELTLAVMLLAGSGLMIHSLTRLLGVRPGFEAPNVLTMRVNRAPAWARDSISRFYDVALDRLARIPGVTSVAIADCPPVNGGCGARAEIGFPDRPSVAAGAAPTAGVHWITPEWPALMQVPLKRGRMLNRGDRRDTPLTVLVNETAAKQFWPNEDPVGRRIVLLGGPHADTALVAGVVGDVLFQAMHAPPVPDVYVNYYQLPLTSRMMLFLRTTGNTSRLAPDVRRALREVAPGFPMYDVQTMSARVEGTVAYSSFLASLFSVFAAVAVALATLGIYGVISFAVAQRTREMGVRLALGATSRDLIRLVVGQGAMLGAVGLACGIAASLGATRILRSMLYATGTADPLTYSAIIGVLAVVVVAASWIPARRAAGVPAMRALRE